MNIYLLTQTANGGYDTYDSCIVCAETEESARTISPSYTTADDPERIPDEENDSYGWVNDPQLVTVKKIGVADDSYTKEQVILSSFNAG